MNQKASTDLREYINCKSCSTAITSTYCPVCGQAAELKRIDSHYIIHEITHVLHLEKGILYTLKQLLINPGTSVRTFITEDRSRLVKPVIFLIVTSLLYSIITHFFHIDGYVSYGDTVEASTTSEIFKWVEAHFGYGNIIMGIFIALWIKLFFRKQPFNFFEILILLCFVMGMGMFIFSLFAIVQGLFHFNIMNVAGFVGLIYTTWAIGHFFNKKKVMSYIKALLAYLLGMITFSALIILIGTLIDKII